MTGASSEVAQTDRGEDDENDETGGGAEGAEDSPQEESDADPERETDIDSDGEEDPEPEAVDLDPLQGLTLELVVDGLHQPLDVAVLPGSPGSAAFLVAERTGDLVLVEDGEPAAEAFLSLDGIVNASTIEQGLLGVASHP